VTLHIYAKDVDDLWKRAVDAGAKVVMPLDNMFWGERYGQLRDPFGHSWSVSMVIQMSPEEMEQKRQQAMPTFSQNQNPGGSE
jgi:PhnB protein